MAPERPKGLHVRRDDSHHARHACQSSRLELVSRLNKAHRRADFRKDKRLDERDHLIRWKKPASIRSLAPQAYRFLPDSIVVRETRIHVEQSGYRSQNIIVVTTLLDHKRTTKEDLAFLYLQRWHDELDLRSIKSTMQMDDLRCKAPELARKEVWTQVLAYNLIRTIMARAAIEHSIQPRTISFKGTIQTLEASQPLIELQEHVNSKLRKQLYTHLLKCIACHLVGNRPGRFEPRKLKRRICFNNFMTKSGHRMQLDMIKRVRETSMPFKVITDASTLVY